MRSLEPNILDNLASTLLAALNLALLSSFECPTGVYGSSPYNR